jgi:hypothetical protein|tara:strand:- start:2176 stop:2838 length:663 start_codon:yes stop_codon:yes gene_type:complete
LKDLDFLWSGEDFKIKDYYLPTDSYIIRMTYGEAQLLNKYCKKATKGILEIGRFFGGSTYFIVASSPENIPVLSVDLKNHIKIYEDEKEVPHRYKELKKAYTSDEYKKVVNYLNEAQQDKKLTLLNVDSKKLELKEDYDVVFIDGDHTYDGVKNDVEKVLRPSTKYIVLHDYFEITKDGSYKKYGVKKYVDELISRNICKKIEQTHTMIVLENIGNEVDD